MLILPVLLLEWAAVALALRCVGHGAAAKVLGLALGIGGIFIAALGYGFVNSSIIDGDRGSDSVVAVLFLSGNIGILVWLIRRVRALKREAR